MSRHLLASAKALLAAVAVGTVVVTAACTSGGDQPQPGRDVQTSGPAAVTWGGESCASSRVTCAEHAGLPTALVHHTAGAGSGVVLIDFGGPGMSVSQSLDRLSDLTIAPSLDVLVVGERWEVEPPSDECLAAEARRIAHWSNLDATSCDLGSLAFAPSSYAAAIEGALAPSQARLVAAVGSSFGAVRVAAATPASVPLLLLSPAPPSGSVASVVGPRAEAIAASSRRSCAGSRDCLAAVEGLLMSGGVDDDLGYESALALIGSAPSTTALHDASSAVAHAADADARSRIRRMAYAATFRYGDGSVLPNLLSYRAGTCGWYTSSPPSASALPSVMERVLACPTTGVGPAATAGPAAQSGPPAVGQRSGCVFTATDDPVTPVAFARSWVQSSPGLRLHEGAMPAHGVVAGHAGDVLAGIPASLARC